MNRKSVFKEHLETVSLRGLNLAPPQVLGGVRLVPLLRDHAPGDLRLAQRKYDEDVAEIQLGSNTSYFSFVPHALVASWTRDGKPASTFGGQIFRRKQHQTSDGRVYNDGFMTARVMSKMRAREGKQQLRFLPLHIAMEGFLALQFGGPTVVWEEYSRSAMSSGLSPRMESSIPGRMIVGLEDALRVFEIHVNQVGMLIFVGDVLASAFVVPHPDDYRQLHRTLITDFYGELIYYSGLYAQEQVYHPEPIDDAIVNSVNDLRNELKRIRSDWSSLHALMTSSLFDRPVAYDNVYAMGPFQMSRFATDFDPKSENHIGESIVRRDGTLEYLKSFRLSAAQCRRAYLLKQLAKNDWGLENCAADLGCTRNQLVFRLEKAGFGYLLHQHVLDAARAEQRRQRKH